MRQIYNAESPPCIMDGCSPPEISTLYSSAVNSITSCTGVLTSTTTMAQSAATINNSSTSTAQLQSKITDGGGGRGGQSDLLQCISDCASASRLSLANLFPSRFELNYYFGLQLILNAV